MKLKTLSKINIYSRYVEKLIIKIIDIFGSIAFGTVFMSFILIPICLINNISEDAFLFFITNMIFNFSVFFGLFIFTLVPCHWLLKYLFIKGSYNQINIDVSNYNYVYLIIQNYLHWIQWITN